MSLCKIQIKETSRGKLTVARFSIIKGETILMVKGIETKVRDRYTLQVGDNIHILPDELAGKYVNHSCSPNSEVINRKFVAVKDIKVGEEITFDYATTEDNIAEPFTCFCGSKDCRGKII